MLEIKKDVRGKWSLNLKKHRTLSSVLYRMSAFYVHVYMQWYEEDVAEYISMRNQINEQFWCMGVKFEQNVD